MSLINKPIVLHFHDANGTGSFPIAVGKLMSEYRKKLKRSMRGVQIFDAYDPSEARDPSGKWTAGGGSSGKSSETKSQTVSFVSPNEDLNNFSFEQAVSGLKTPRQKLLHGISHQIDSDFGINDIRVNHVIGAWSDGAENSVMTNSESTDLDVETAAACMKAYLANQKAVLLFHPSTLEEGHDYLAQFRVNNNNLAEIHKKLLDSDITFHTLEPRGDDTIVHFYGSTPEDLKKFSDTAKEFDAKVAVHPGNGSFIGTVKEDGTDAEQREDARKVYQETIERVGTAGKLPLQWRTTWQNHIDNWERETGEQIGGERKSPATGDEERLSEEEFLKGAWLKQDTLNKPEPKPDPDREEDLKTKDHRWKDVIIHTLDGVLRFNLKDAEFKREDHPFAPTVGS
jgi:hypothetical protein